MLVYGISIVGSIIFGAIIDRIGRNAQAHFDCAVLITKKYVQMIVLSAAFGVLAHLTLTITHLTPFVPVVTCVCFCHLYVLCFQSVLGISYSILAAALWPCVAFVVPERILGTAFGVITALQNLVSANQTNISKQTISRVSHYFSSPSAHCSTAAVTFRCNWFISIA